MCLIIEISKEQTCLAFIMIAVKFINLLLKSYLFHKILNNFFLKDDSRNNN